MDSSNVPSASVDTQYLIAANHHSDQWFIPPVRSGCAFQLNWCILIGCQGNLCIQNSWCFVQQCRTSTLERIRCWEKNPWLSSSTAVFMIVFLFSSQVCESGRMMLAVGYGKRSPCWQDASRRRPFSVFVPLSPGWSCLTPMSPAAHWSSRSGTTQSHQSGYALLITSSARRRWQRGRTTLNLRQVRRIRMAINKTHQRIDCEVYWYFHGCSESYLWDTNHEIQ